MYGAPMSLVEVSRPEKSVALVRLGRPEARGRFLRR
jgi:hypothetical protein